MGSGVGSLLGAVGDLRKGAAADFAGEWNAVSLEQNATWAREKGRRDEAGVRLNAKKEIGDMRANYAASGVQLDGSIMDVLEESAINAEKDALNVRYASQRDAYNYNRQAFMERRQGKEAKTNSYISASGKWLEAAGSGMSGMSGGGAGGAAGGMGGGGATSMGGGSYFPSNRTA